MTDFSNEAQKTRCKPQTPSKPTEQRPSPIPITRVTFLIAAHVTVDSGHSAKWEFPHHSDAVRIAFRKICGFDVECCNQYGVPA